jgi:hypothetical protein
MGRQKRHHTVMRALLEGFALDNKIAVRSRNGAQFLTAPINATVVSDFYSFEEESQPSAAVEEWLAKRVESPFAELLPSLRAGERIPVEWASVIVQFIATAIVRTRTTRAYMAQIDRHLSGPVILQTVAPRMGWDLARMSTDEVEGLLALCEGLWQEISEEAEQRASALRTMIRHSQIIQNNLEPYDWSTLGTSQPQFLLGDVPVLTVATHKTGWHGLIPEGAVVFMPLSPDRLLVGKPKTLTTVILGQNLVTAINSRTVGEAQSDVFHHPTMQWPAELILDANTPELPAPSRTLRPAPPGTPPTFPAKYPNADDPDVAAVLKRLRAATTVT